MTTINIANTLDSVRREYATMTRTFKRNARIDGWEARRRVLDCFGLKGARLVEQGKRQGSVAMVEMGLIYQDVAARRVKLS